MPDALAITTAPAETHNVRVSVDLTEIQEHHPEVTGIQDCVRDGIAGITVHAEDSSTLVIQGPVSVDVDPIGYVTIRGVDDPRMNIVLQIGRLLVQTVSLDGCEVYRRQAA